MIDWLLYHTRLKDWDYDRATNLWYWWHRRVCHWTGHSGRDDGTGLRFSTGIRYWLFRLQLHLICGPLDDWSHTRREVVNGNPQP